MVRAPCCEKMGLKKGPWTSEEDQILINYIQLYGHGNWRALPKQAGLLRCGKSCRLRWTNYLRPDIKRGNFSREEEDTIIQLHEALGNRWSAIAARLPGRTDNEIKNVWHTHLKKRLIKQNQNQNHHHQNPETTNTNTKRQSKCSITTTTTTTKEQEPVTDSLPISPPRQCSSSDDISSSSVTTSTGDNTFPEMDDNFWSEVLPAENSSTPLSFHDFPFTDTNNEHVHYAYMSDGDGMDFWYDLFARSAGDQIPELPEF